MEYLLFGLVVGYVLASVFSPLLILWWEERDLRKQWKNRKD